jgi:preprotein translocase subunit SecE
VARNRKRARDRKRREDPSAAPPEEGRRGTDETTAPVGAAATGADSLSRENAPAAWQHGGDVDEVEASLVAGADGQTAPEGAAEEAFEESESSATQVVAPRPRSTRGGPRFWQFLKACWAELQRVQWPDRRQVSQATAVVLGFVVIAGTYLGVADRVAKEIVDFIL